MSYELKTKLNDASVEGFLNSVEDEQKRADCFEILEMMREITGKEPKMWGASIIGFDSYRYTYASGQSGDWPIIGFSPRKQNITLYIMDGYQDYAKLLAKIGKYKIGKSCLYIKKLADIDVAVLKDMMVKSVKHMREEYGS